MRPSDMDAIARVVAQQVKEIVDKKLAGVEPTAPYDDNVLMGLIAAQEEQIAGLKGDVANLIKLAEGHIERIDALEKAMPEPLDVDGIKADVASEVIKDLPDSILKAVDDGFDARFADLKGEPGEKGEPGDKGEKGDTGSIGIPGFSPDDDQLRELIEPLIPEPIKGEKGDKGDLGDVPSPAEVVAQIKGDSDFNGRLNDYIKRLIPEPIKGEKGDQGEVDHDALTALVKAHMPEAPTALAPTDLQVIEAVKAVYPSIRMDLIKRLPAMMHQGVWKADLQYDVGDEVVQNGSTYRMMEPTTAPPPSAEWQMIAQGKAGKQGKPGPAGEQGPVGVSVKEIAFDAENGALLFELTDGDVRMFNLKEMIEPFILKTLDPNEQEDH